MAFIKWTDTLSVQHETIDTQHQQLISLLNKLYTAFIDKKQHDVLKEIVDELGDYTEYHFKTEEKLFLQYNYALAKEHLEEHDEFIKTVVEFKKEYERNPGALTYKLMTFLKKWVCEHIQGSDKKYMPMFN